MQAEILPSPSLILQTFSGFVPLAAMFILSYFTKKNHYLDMNTSLFVNCTWVLRAKLLLNLHFFALKESLLRHKFSCFCLELESTYKYLQKKATHSSEKLNIYHSNFTRK